MYNTKFPWNKKLESDDHRRISERFNKLKERAAKLRAAAKAKQLKLTLVRGGK